MTMTAANTNMNQLDTRHTQPCTQHTQHPHAAGSRKPEPPERRFGPTLRLCSPLRSSLLLPLLFFLPQTKWVNGDDAQVWYERRAAARKPLPFSARLHLVRVDPSSVVVVVGNGAASGEAGQRGKDEGRM